MEYTAFITAVGNLNKLLTDVIKDEFARLGVHGVTPVQALMLYRLGDRKVNATELKSLGIYHGSNVSYNLRKMVEAGYLDQVQDKVDKRQVIINLTDTGAGIRDIVVALFERHGQTLRDLPDIAPVERYLQGQVRYIY